MRPVGDRGRTKSLVSCGSVRAARSCALIYQHQARGADKVITDNIDAHVEAERNRKEDGDDDGTAGVLVPVG